jgi:hypothetical protein
MSMYSWSLAGAGACCSIMASTKLRIMLTSGKQIITSGPVGLTISSRREIKKGKSKELKIPVRFLQFRQLRRTLTEEVI